MIFMITACGGKLDTNLVVNDDMSGTRTFTLTAEISSNKEYVKGELPEITETIKKNCPADLTFTDKSDASNAVFEFTLSFSSLEDYETKLRNLLSLAAEDVGYASDKTVLTFSKPDNVFASGVSLKEEYSNSNYMRWLENLLIDSGYIDASNRSNILGSGTTTYNICGASGEGSSQINVNTIESIQINSIELFTDINPDGTFNRKINVNIPQVSMDKKGEEIKEFLAANESGSVKGEWTEAGGVSTYTLTASNINLADLNGMMKKFYGIDAEYVTENNNPENTLFTDPAGSGDIQKRFYGVVEFMETADLSNYTLEFNSDLLKYYVPFNDNTASYNASYNDSGNGYMILYPTDWNKFEYKFQSRVILTLEQATINLTYGEGDKVTREVQLIYSNVLGEEALKALETRLDATCEGAEVKVTKCVCTDNKVNVTIESHGKIKSESDEWKKSFGGVYELGYKFTSTTMNPKTTTTFKDSFDLTAFTSGAETSINVIYNATGFPKMNDHSETITVTDLSAPVEIKVSENGLNIVAIIIYAVIVLAVVAAVIVTIVVVKKLGKKKAEGIQAPAAYAAPVAMPAAPEAMQAPESMQAPEAMPMTEPAPVAIPVPVPMAPEAVPEAVPVADPEAVPMPAVEAVPVAMPVTPEVMQAPEAVPMAVTPVESAPEAAPMAEAVPEAVQEAFDENKPQE